MAPEFLFIGDSLIEFFNWQKRFPDRKVYNFGSAGETTEGLFARLPIICRRVESPDLVMIMTGTNNIAMEDYGFLLTYEKIIHFLKDEYSGITIVMTSLLPIELFFLGEAVPRVNSRLRDIAENNEIRYLDLYPLFLDKQGRANKTLFEFDGVHLSEKGYEVWSGALERTILQTL